MSRPPTIEHEERLMKMATFLRDLVALARTHNGPQEHWEAERLAEAAAMEAGAAALREKGDES